MWLAGSCKLFCAGGRERRTGTGPGSCLPGLRLQPARAAARDGRCPECAGLISDSLRADLLCFAQPRYVRRLARANRCATLGLGSILTVVVAAFVGPILFLIAGSDSPAVAVIANLVGVLLLLGGLLCLAGVILLTSPQPGVFRTQRGDAARRLVRIALLVGVGAWAGNWVMTAVAPPLTVMAIFALACALCSAFAVLGVASWFRHVRDVAERIPDHGAALKAGALARNVAIAVGVLVGFHLIDSVLWWGPALIRGGTTPLPATSSAASGESPWKNPYHSVKTCTEAVVYLAVLVYIVRAFSLHRRLQPALRQQLALAEQLAAGRAPQAAQSEISANYAAASASAASASPDTSGPAPSAGPGAPRPNAR